MLAAKRQPSRPHPGRHKRPHDDGLQLAIDKAGGPVRLAALLTALGSPVTYNGVSQWRRTPPLRVLEVEKVTGVHRSILRPDIYPPEPVST